MKKLFISQPMKGKSDEDILAQDFFVDNVIGGKDK